MNRCELLNRYWDSSNEIIVYEEPPDNCSDKESFIYGRRLERTIIFDLIKFYETIIDTKDKDSKNQVIEFVRKHIENNKNYLNYLTLILNNINMFLEIEGSLQHTEEIPKLIEYELDHLRRLIHDRK